MPSELVVALRDIAQLRFARIHRRKSGRFDRVAGDLLKVFFGRAEIGNLLCQFHRRGDHNRPRIEGRSSLQVRIDENASGFFKDNLIGGDVPWPLLDARRVVVMNSSSDSIGILGNPNHNTTISKSLSDALA